MTADRAALVERVFRIIYDPLSGTADWNPIWRERATAAIDLVRNETLEEAARVCENASPWHTRTDVAAAIRALKGNKMDVAKTTTS